MPLAVSSTFSSQQGGTITASCFSTSVGITALRRKWGYETARNVGKGVDDLAQKDQVNRPTGKALETMKKILRSRFITTAHVMFGRDVEALTKTEIYKTIAATAKQSISDNWIKTNKQYAERQEKQIYYFSIEFLLGRLLKSNLINLGIEEALKDVLKDFNLNLSDAYEEEPDAGLGNGGLGRLAACFIDSLAAHRVAGLG